MKWVSDVSKIAYQPNANILLWLTKPYVLSHALKRVCKVFSLKIISQGMTHTPFDDRIKLALDKTASSFVREVLLEGDGIALTYGRVTIPSLTYHKHIDLFNDLDEQPIGEKILYNRPDVERSAFEYAFFNEKAQWGRRSIFFIQGSPLLVTESLFPSLPDYPTD